jgi:hypothetical protein
MNEFMLVIRILVTLVLFLGVVIGMAICNGILAGLAQDTERAKEGRIMNGWQHGYVIREYKKTNPGGRKHLQAYFAGFAGFAFLLALVGWLLFLGWS